jgi:alpha-1,6-mannosyltransferase
MKICDIVQFYSPLSGGVKRYLEDKVRYISQNTDHCHMVIVPSERNAIRNERTTKFYEIKSLRLIGSLSYRMLLNRKRIISIVEEEKPDLIEVGDPYRSAWIALEAAKQHDIPIVAFYHSDFPRALGRTISRFCGSIMENNLSGWVNRYVCDLYNRMNATIVASRRMERILRDCGIENVVRIPLGTDIDSFHSNPDAIQVRRKLGLTENDILLLFVGRLGREKNIHSLIGMMDYLPPKTSRNGNYHLLLVGDGELRDFVQKAIHSRSNISWFQYSTDISQLTSYYTAADLFVHAGRYETFGITSLESQACGTRVLAVREGGLDETVEGEFPPIMADTHRPADLAAAIHQIEKNSASQSPHERRQRIVEHFSIQLTFQRLMSLYEHIAERKPVDEFSIERGEEQTDELRYSSLLTR